MEDNEIMVNDNEEIEESCTDIAEVSSGNELNIAAGLLIAGVIGAVGALMVDKLGKPALKKIRNRWKMRHGKPVDADFEDVVDDDEEEESEDEKK